jgi:hypothetical protein
MCILRDPVGLEGEHLLTAGAKYTHTGRATPCEAAIRILQPRQMASGHGSGIRLLHTTRCTMGALSLLASSCLDGGERYCVFARGLQCVLACARRRGLVQEASRWPSHGSMCIQHSRGSRFRPIHVTRTRHGHTGRSPRAPPRASSRSAVCLAPA